MTALAQLSDLAHLVEMELYCVNIDLTGEIPTKQFPSLRVLQLLNISLLGADSDGMTVCRLISRLFPNLQKLHLLFKPEVRRRTVPFEAKENYSICLSHF